MESSTALKKIINGGPLHCYTPTMLKKLSRVELALAAAKEALRWGNIHIVTLDEVQQFKAGLLELINEQY